jgi:hypothetical protein
MIAIDEGTITKINDWFFLTRRKHLIMVFPDYINFDIIMKSLYILFESEHYNVLSSTLQFLYVYVAFSSSPPHITIITITIIIIITISATMVTNIS